MAAEPARPMASVIIPTRNGMPLFERCLRGILAQQTPWPFEVIVVDSSSSDGTWELAGKLGVTRYRIDPRDFNHGRTRNWAAAKARGEFLVFFVQDAIPVDERWIETLVEPFADPSVAGTYSRQVPRRESELITKYLSVGTTPSGLEPRVKRLSPSCRLSDLPPHAQFDLALFQNNSSCIRAGVFAHLQFSEVPYGEDMDWGKRALDSGYALVYQPKSAVFHSHDRPASYAFKRAYADHFQARQLFGMQMIPHPWKLLRSALWNTRTAWQFGLTSEGSLRSKLKLLWSAPLYALAVAAGQFLGPQNTVWLEKSRQAAHLDRWLRRGV